MFFSIEQLERRPADFAISLHPGELDFLAPKLRQVSPLVAAGRAELVSSAVGEIRTKGHLAVEMEAECDRCLDPARFPLEADFEVYSHPAQEPAGGGSEEVEIGEADTAVNYYDGSGIELGDILREEVLLRLPMRRVCGPECQGICPQCGRNRNREVCGCGAKPADPRWHALKEIARK